MKMNEREVSVQSLKRICHKLRKYLIAVIEARLGCLLI